MSEKESPESHGAVPHVHVDVGLSSQDDADVLGKHFLNPNE
jgi:hypothetical protein